MVLDHWHSAMTSVGCVLCRDLPGRDNLSRAVDRDDLAAIRANRHLGSFSLFGAMRWAVALGREAAAVKLREYGADVDVVECIQHSALHGHLGVLALLYSWYHAHEDCAIAVAIALDRAAENGQLVAMALLKSWGGAGRWPNTALIYAAEGNHPAAMRLLVEWGDADFEHAIENAADEIDDVPRTVNTLRRWQAKIAREKHHAALLDAALALRPLHLPIYQLLWLLEWVVVPTGDLKRQGAYVPGPLPELARVRLLERLLQ